VVRVVEIEGISKEFCGGTHVSNTSEIGVITLTSVKTVASQIKRIEGLTGLKAYELLTEKRNSSHHLQMYLKHRKKKLLIKQKKHLRH